MESPLYVKFDHERGCWLGIHRTCGNSWKAYTPRGAWKLSGLHTSGCDAQ